MTQLTHYVKVLTNKSSFSDSKYVVDRLFLYCTNPSQCTFHFSHVNRYSGIPTVCAESGWGAAIVGMQISDTKYQTQMHHLLLNMSISHPCLQRNLSVLLSIYHSISERCKKRAWRRKVFPTNTRDKILKMCEKKQFW